MNKTFRMLALALLLVPASIAAGLTGTWVFQLPASLGGNGQQKVTLALTAQNKNLTGTVTTNGNSAPITNGKANGNKFSFSVNAPSGVVAYSGALKGANLNLTIKSGSTTANVMAVPPSCPPDCP